MRFRALFACFASILSTTAFAQSGQMLSRQPVELWTGAHIGVNGGGGFGTVKTTNNSVTVPPATARLSDGSADIAGGFGGAQIGYDKQFGSMVVGIEADFQGSTIIYRESFTALNVTATEEFNVKAFGTIRGRVGVAFDSFLLYATAGGAFANSTATLELPNAKYSKSAWHSGYVVGAGAEYAFDRVWSARVEYLYADLGSGPYDIALPAGASAHLDAKYDMHLVRAGLNLRF